MSNVGLNSSIYHSVRSYLDLLNDFVVDLNYAFETDKLPDRTLVVDFFTTLNDRSNLDTTLRLIRVMFFDYFQEKKRDPEKALQDFTEKLQAGIIDKRIIPALEDFIDVLKYQCDESYARLKQAD